MMDPRKIGQFLMGEWDKTKQPLEERLSMLPFGKYQDGSVGMAWPGFMAAPAEAGQRAADSGMPLSTTDPAGADAAYRDVAEVALGTMLGGSVASMGSGAARGAVGSAGGKLTQGAADLPMDLASRMARATDQGYTIDAYKGGYPYKPDSGPTYQWKTVNGKWGPHVVPGTENSPLIPLETLDNPNKPYAGFFSDSKDVANRFTAPNGEFSNPVVWPVKLKMENPLVIDGKGKHAAAFQFDDIAKRDGMIDELQAFKSAFEDGSPYDGVIVNNTLDEGTVYIPKAGKQVRSVNAAFDPARSDSANLLAANAKPGATLPLAADGGEQQDLDPALLAYLKQIGLY